MNVDRFRKRVEVLKTVRDNFKKDLKQTFWDSYDEAHREHMAAFICALIPAISAVTALDQKEIAGEIGVTCQAVSGWKKEGNVCSDNLQRLRDLSDEVGAEQPDFGPASERYNAALMGAMRCLLENLGETAGCDLSDDFFKRILRTPFESWAMVAHDESLLESSFQSWLSGFPATNAACSPRDLFYKWVPALIVCLDEFNQRGVRQ